ncbi:MAG TPA: hypothetical protein VM695_01215 [Phycisphaerae bacterium]|nr:hypothetical protein [Phycisphaerae bacterium]
MRTTAASNRTLRVSLLAGAVLALLGPSPLRAQRYGAEARSSYDDVADIDAYAAALRKEIAEAKTHSFSRAWFGWNRLLTQYQDNGRKDAGALKVLAAVFRGAMFDRYRALEAQGEGELFHVFYGGASKGGTGPLKHDVHGGGGHGGWGGTGRMRIYEELARQGVLTADEQALYRKIVLQSLGERFVDFGDLERGANNRPYANNGGVAIALRLFGDMPRAKEVRAWLDRQWRELAEYGDTTEVNYYPYGPLFLHGMLDLAEELGKLKTERELVYALGRRYLAQVHGGGVRGNPNSGARAHRDLAAIAADPWQVGYYDERDAHVWYRFAKEFKDPEFLWAAVQVALGGAPPDGKVPPEWQQAYDARFGVFSQMGLKPKCPPGRSAVDVVSPLKHKRPERLYLCPGRQSGKPFVSYYIHDRNNEYMHCFGDAAGRLYEYAVDGTKLLHGSGKYNGIFLGQAAYDMLLVLHPSEAFPMHVGTDRRGQPKAFMGAPSGAWNTASGTLHMVPGSRTAPDSRNWRLGPGTGMPWKRTDDPVGGAAANMDGLWGLNDELRLRTVTLVFHGDPNAQAKPETVSIRNLRLAGPKGDVMLAKLDRLLANVRVSRFVHDPAANDLYGPAGKDETQRTGEELTRAAAIVDDGGKALRLTVRPGFSYKLTVTGLDRTFSVHDDYTRLRFDYKAVGNDPFGRRDRGWRYQRAGWPMLVADPVLNGRSLVHVHQTRGGILEPDSLRAENEGDDSFGQFTYRSCFAARSRWTRQSVLTAEGVLVVADRYTPGPDADGYQAGPVWLLRAEGRWTEGKQDNGRAWWKFQNDPPAHDGRRNWFDAPPYDHAWWQTQPKRLLVYVHHEPGQTYGQLQHESSPDISRDFRTNSSFARAIVRAGQTKVFLSVLVPHNESEPAAGVAAQVRTSLDADGSCEATIGGIRVSVSANGEWRVRRGA